MTTATLVAGNRTMDTETGRPRRSLEELVDNLIDALFPAQTEAVEQSATRSIHEARRLRQAGDVDGGLAILAGMDMGKVETREARWAFSEWKQLGEAAVRWLGRGALHPGHGTGRRPGAPRRRRDA